MEQNLPISNEAEFEKWLATAFEFQLQRLREETATECQKRKDLEDLKRDSAKETQHEEEL